MLLTLSKLLTRLKSPMMLMLLTLCSEVPMRKRQTMIFSPSTPRTKPLMRRRLLTDSMSSTLSRLLTKLRLPMMPMLPTLYSEVPTRKRQITIFSLSTPWMKQHMRQRQLTDLMLLTLSRLPTRLKFHMMPMLPTHCTELPMNLR